MTLIAIFSINKHISHADFPFSIATDLNKTLDNFRELLKKSQKITENSSHF